MKKHFYFLPIIIFSSILFLGNLDGSLPQNTGAPGDLTCGRAPCHNVPNNVGDATISVEFSGNSGQYFADSTYQLMVKIENPQSSRNGFQILALDQSDQNVGTWQLLDANKMKIIPGIGFPNRKYVTHRAAGNEQTEWTVAWKAPSMDVGTVTFYASVNSTNDNGLNTGDEVYTTSLSVEYEEPSSIGGDVSSIIKVFPTVSGGKFWMDFPTTFGVANISLHDLQGSVQRQLEIRSGGLQELEVHDLNAGVYFLKIISENGQFAVKKIIVQ